MMAMKISCLTIATIVLLANMGCRDRKLPQASNKLPDVRGGSTLSVSNQIPAPSPRSDSEPTKPRKSFLDPKGTFTLIVSNQSYAISQVDIRVEIDGELVVSDDFKVAGQHSFIPFKLNLPEGKHHIRIWSEKGSAELAADFEVDKNIDTGLVTYWYYPESHRNPTPRSFNFRASKGPLKFM